MDWNSILLAAFPLVGVLIGAVTTGWMSIRREKSAREDERSRQAEQLRREAFSDLLVEVAITSDKLERQIKAGYFFATDLQTARARAEMLSTEDEARELAAVLDAFFMSHYREVDAAREGIMRIYRR